MRTHQTLFDQFTTADAIREKLKGLAAELITASPQHTHSIDPSTPYEKILDAMSELSYPELQHHKRPVHILSTICHLLIRLGDARSMNRCLQLAHRIYSFKCKQDESWYASYLYKGVAQIGLNLAETGITNVLFGISRCRALSVWPEDEALGNWAIMSAAIANKNLKMAMSYARKWHAIAYENGIRSERLRAETAILILNLLYGNPDEYASGIREIKKLAIGEWRDIVNYLAKWVEARLSDICIPQEETQPAGEPLPLFAGIAWYLPDALGESGNKGDFAFICRLRRRYCHKNSVGAACL